MNESRFVQYRLLPRDHLPQAVFVRIIIPQQVQRAVQQQPLDLPAK